MDQEGNFGYGRRLGTDFLPGVQVVPVSACPIVGDLDGTSAVGYSCNPPEKSALEAGNILGLQLVVKHWNTCPGRSFKRLRPYPAIKAPTAMVSNSTGI